MTQLASASAAVEDAQLKRRREQDRVAAAFQRLFGPSKKATAEDRNLVLAALEALCCARTELMVPGEPDVTQHRIGRFAVWQYIQNMRFPRRRPVDADQPGDDDGRSGPSDDAAAQPGPGVAERTDD